MLVSKLEWNCMQSDRRPSPSMANEHCARSEAPKLAFSRRVAKARETAIKLLTATLSSKY